MKVESIAECSPREFCNTFDLHLAIIGLENQFSVFFLSGCLRFYCIILYMARNLVLNMISEHLSDKIPSQMNILNMLVPILIHNKYCFLLKSSENVQCC